MGVEALGSGLPPAAPVLKAAPGVAADAVEAPVQAEAPASPEEALRLSIARQAGWASLDEAEDAPTPVRHPRKT
jgi:hypothetical protein